MTCTFAFTSCHCNSFIPSIHDTSRIIGHSLHGIACTLKISFSVDIIIRSHMSRTWRSLSFPCSALGRVYLSAPIPLPLHISFLPIFVSTQPMSIGDHGRVYILFDHPVHTILSFTWCHMIQPLTSMLLNDAFQSASPVSFPRRFLFELCTYPLQGVLASILNVKAF